MAFSKAEEFEEKDILAARFAKALSHPARIAIVRLLANQVVRVRIVAYLRRWHRTLFLSDSIENVRTSLDYYILTVKTCFWQRNCFQNSYDLIKSFFIGIRYRIFTI